MKKQLPVLTIVVPCYNEEEVLPETINRLSAVLQDLCGENLIRKNSRILFVDDGSSDRTWPIIARESIKNPFVTGIKLSRNVGHQKALWAGYMKAREKSDCVISIDADLQDDIQVIKTFMEKYHEGYEIVYGVRRKRDTDTFFKRTTALLFYRFMEKFGIELVYNHADFRLLSKRALDELARYHEQHLFLRGILPQIGFKSAKVYYDRKERLAGETKYPLKKMVAFALDGITSFSIVPLRLITFAGFFLFVTGILLGIYSLVKPEQPASFLLYTFISVFTGLQLLAIGVIGEYIGKIFYEVKRRPKYAIEIDLFTSPILKSNKGQDRPESGYSVK